MNRAEFDGLEDEMRVQYEGYRAGMYVRVEIAEVPCEFVTNFDPTYPVILGGLLNVEENIGYVQVRLKYYPKNVCFLCLLLIFKSTTFDL